MCFDPITMMVVATTVATVAGAGAQAYAGKVEAEGQMAAAEGQRQQNEYNAKVAEYNAGVSAAEGAAKAEQISAEARQLSASQRAAAAASGRNPDAGSPSLMIADTERNRALDTMSTLWSTKTEIDSYKQQATGERLAGANAVKAGKTAAKGSFLSGLGRAASTLGSINPSSLRVS